MVSIEYDDGNICVVNSTYEVTITMLVANANMLITEVGKDYCVLVLRGHKEDRRFKVRKNPVMYCVKDFCRVAGVNCD